MKKTLLFAFLFFSSFLLSQSWYQNENSFENPNRGVYDNLNKKKQREINQEMGSIKKIFSKTESIVKFVQEENNEVQTTQSAGPRAPGEPVPIDKYKGWLFLIGLIFIVFKKKSMKFGRASI